MSQPSAGHDTTGGLIDRSEAAFVAYRAGDDDGMEQLVDMLTPILWHAARGRGADPATAEDVVQRAWLALVDHADRVREPRAVLGWLLTTVRRDATTRMGRLARTIPSDDPTTDEPSTDPEPEVVVVRSERQLRLWDHVQRLSERCQYLLRVIAFAERPDYAAISESLGMPIGSIGPTRGRCLEKLRRSLGDDPAWEGDLP